jgi:P-type E1-E2 ATPase
MEKPKRPYSMFKRPTVKHNSRGGVDGDGGQERPAHSQSHVVREHAKTEGRFGVTDTLLKGAIALADIVRPEAKQAIDALKAFNIRCIMLTGDSKATAKWVSDQVGLDEYFAEVLPQDKAAKVKEVQSRGILVAMTGDGVNDAPAWRRLTWASPSERVRTWQLRQPM